MCRWRVVASPPGVKLSDVMDSEDGMQAGRFNPNSLCWLGACSCTPRWHAETCVRRCVALAGTLRAGQWLVLSVVQHALG